MKALAACSLALAACAGYPAEAPADSGAPTLSVALFSPLPGATFSQDAGPAIEVTTIVENSDGPIASAELAVDGDPYITRQDAGNPPSWRLLPSSYEPGEHVVSVTVKNAAQERATASRGFVVTR